MRDITVKELKEKLENCNDNDIVMLEIDIDYDFDIGKIEKNYTLDVKAFTRYIGRDGNYVILSSNIKNDTYKGVI